MLVLIKWLVVSFSCFLGFFLAYFSVPSIVFEWV